MRRDSRQLLRPRAGPPRRTGSLTVLLPGLLLPVPALAAPWPANDAAFAPLLAGFAVLAVCIVFKALRDCWRLFHGPSRLDGDRNWHLLGRRLKH